MFEPFIISRICGSFKIHREGYPARPIVSATNCMGKSLSRWMLRKLDILAKYVGKNQVKSSSDLFKKINCVNLRKNEVLVAWDFESMFTNISFQITKDIIEKYYYLIQEETTVPLDVFLKALTFLIEECAFFTFEEEIYLQVDGLSMGNQLSQVLAEITTSHFLNEVFLEYNSGGINFMYKYVDDIISAIDKRFVSTVQSSIENLLGGMKLKLTAENEDCEVDFLQMRIRRDLNNQVNVRWMQKEYSAKRILDFHSFHPSEMKRNVVKEFIRSALSLTSSQHRSKTFSSIRKTLKGSNYPDYYINSVIGSLKASKCKREHYDVERRFVAFPYVPGTMNFVRRTINKIN